MTREEHFLSLVHPDSRGVAEDFVNGKIDAMFLTYKPKAMAKFGYTVLNRTCIEIFENNIETPSKIIEFNDDEKDMEHDDISMICDAVYKYGDMYDYVMLKRVDKNEWMRKALMHTYMERPEDCPAIMKKKCQKIYDSLSDSDKLLLELDLDYD